MPGSGAIMPIDRVSWSALCGALALIAFGFSMTACVVVPPRDGLARVHVGDVVRRIMRNCTNSIQ